MPARPERHFRPDYASARAAFLAAAHARGARIASDPLAVRGERGEELAVDTAYLGPDAPEALLVVSSGIHGVEGFAGSAIQHQLLDEQLDGLALGPAAGVLVVHALNPAGFARLRRVNEANVDLNRNFVRHPDEHLPNPDYEALDAAINPERLDAESEADSRRRLLAFAHDHGFARLQEVLTRGQYVRPSGVQFGGERAEPSNRILRDVVARETRGARRVAWVDLHTGLGPYGEVEMITECPPEHPACRRGRAWWGERAKSTRGGGSVSAPLHGTMERGVEQALGPDCELTAFGAEFGTYEPTRVFWAMRADNWLHRHGDPESEQGHAIKAEILEVFRPADRAWQERVLSGAARVLEQARAGLLREPG
jgi:hypothetical protein